MVSIARLAAAFRTELGELEAEVWKEELEPFAPEHVAWAVREAIDLAYDYMPKLPEFKRLVLSCPSLRKDIETLRVYQAELFLCGILDNDMGKEARNRWRSRIAQHLQVWAQAPQWFSQQLSKLLEETKEGDQHERR